MSKKIKNKRGGYHKKFIFTNEQIQEMLRLNQFENKTIEDIANIYKVSYPYILKLFKNNNFQYKSADQIKNNLPDKQKIFDLHLIEKKSIIDISKIYNIIYRGNQNKGNIIDFNDYRTVIITRKVRHYHLTMGVISHYDGKCRVINDPFEDVKNG